MATSLIELKNSTFKRGEINTQQWSFIKNLLANETFDATKAAKKAGYSSPSQAASRLLNNRKIKHELGNEIRNRWERLEWTGDEVVRLLKKIIEVDVTELYDSEGYITIEKVKSLAPEVRQLINKIDVKHRVVEDELTGENVKVAYVVVEWMSKDHALTLAMKHFGLMQPELHLNIIGDDMKRQVITEMMHRLESDSSQVIDATAIRKLAQEDD